MSAAGPSVNGLSRAALGWLLSFRLRQDRPHGESGAIPTTLPSDRIKIGAVQWQADPVARADDWSRRVEERFREAREAHCHMLVFPEYLPLSLLGVVMPRGTAAATLTDDTIRSLLRSLAPVTFGHWSRWMAHLSRKYQMVTVAGSGLTLYQGRLLNVALGFDHQGRQILWQPKWHLMADERRWGVEPGPAVNPDVMEPWGLTALVCNDASYYESFRIVERRGALIAAVPIADPDPRYTVGKARRGCFSRVQDVPMVGVAAASTGRLFGVRLTGKAGIYVPWELSDDQTGVLAESPHPAGEGLVAAVVSLAAVRAFQLRHREAHPAPPAEFLEPLYQFEEDN